MFRVVSYVKIEQQPSIDWPKRSTVLNFDFVTEFECSDSWRDLTNKGKLTIPKNLYYRDGNNKLQPLKGTNINVGGFSSVAPLFLRGDKVTITAGYKYFNKAHREIEDTAVMFTGFITKVGSKMPIEVDLEDNMWLLKTTSVPVATFGTKDRLETILDFIISSVNKAKGTRLTTFVLSRAGATKTLFLNQSFHTYGESGSQILQRLQKTYGFEFYFRGNELRGGTLIYIEDEAVTEHFHFQENIISDELEYKRKDDVKLSCKAYNTITESGLAGFCKDGSIKTKKRRIEVLVTINEKSPTGYDFIEIKRGDFLPENTDGERKDFKGMQGDTAEEIAFEAYNQLKKYYYTGFRGTFTTFGIPFIKQGDNVIIKDPILPERDGKYKVKAVDYAGGASVGLRQVLHLDYKLI
jgi:hypothetical protein